MDNAMQIKHKFVDHKECEEKKVSNEKPKIATICVGSTGTGKSSLINLFSTQKVKIGHGTRSETQRASLVTSTDNGYWLDSQGANDSSGVDDEKILSAILKELYDRNVNKIKVVWCVSGDMCREKQEFQHQARFIKSLGNGIWSSCLIIVKKGRTQPKKMDGVLAAARRYDANINENDSKHLFGYTGLEFGDLSRDTIWEVINKHIKDDAERKQALLECGYLTNTQIVAHVAGKLSELSSLSIRFENKKCAKCGVKGDPRFIYAPCHTDLEKYHPKHIVRYHPSCIEYVHIGSIVYYHSGSECTNSSTTYYHPGSLKRTVFWPETIFLACHVSFYDKYSCCGGSRGESGCSVYSTHTSSYYSCCGSSSSSGCCKRYCCCERSVSSSGCRAQWKCCGALEDNTGCRQRYECCEKDMGKEGCEERCKSCKTAWRKAPGCIRTTPKQY